MSVDTLCEQAETRIRGGGGLSDAGVKNGESVFAGNGSKLENSGRVEACSSPSFRR